MKNEKLRTLIGCLLLLLSLLSVSLGIIRGEDSTVKRKATNICMECIGIG